MHFFTKTAIIFLAATSISFISCKNKSQKLSIVGKWIFKEMSYLPGNRTYDNLNEKQKQLRKEETEMNAKGTTFQFNKDGTYMVTAGGQKAESLNGTYTLEGDNKVLLKRGDREAQTAIISFPGTNLLKIDDGKTKISILLERLE